MAGQFQEVVDNAILAAFEGGNVPHSVDDALNKANVASEEALSKRAQNVAFGTAHALGEVARLLDEQNQ